MGEPWRAREDAGGWASGGRRGQGPTPDWPPWGCWGKSEACSKLQATQKGPWRGRGRWSLATHLLLHTVGRRQVPVGAATVLRGTGGGGDRQREARR